jgi:predicted DNA-binding transcriptional regulator YafY
LVYTGVRWHIRAYDSEREEFRNFALQRIEDPKPVIKNSPVAPDEDVDWVRRSTLCVVPNPKLNPHQQRLVARDFGMTQTPDGPIWKVELRHCLIGYFAAKYGLDRGGTSTQQRIVLRDLTSFRQWLMPTGET